MIFELGAWVAWTSQAAGIARTKTGYVLARVAPHIEPNDMLEQAGVRGRISGPGWPRDHLSYVVRANGRLYWPRVSLLKAVPPTAVQPDPEEST